MKLFISLLLLCSIAEAKLIKVTYSLESEKKAQLISKVLREKFYIPELLINKEVLDIPCHKDNKTIVHLCIDEENELKLLWMDRKRFDYTLSHLIEFPTLDIASKGEK